LADLICRGGAAARTHGATYAVPMYKPGNTAIEMRRITKNWCPPQARKRPIDVVLLSIGGNDVGFAQLVGYAMTEGASDFAPIAVLAGSSIRFGPDVSRHYLDMLDKRMKAVKDALHDGFGVTPNRVFQTTYEPLQFDETGALCGGLPTLGMDVHPGLKYSKARLQEVSNYVHEFLGRLECISGKGKSCPGNLATGAGTGFTLVSDHMAAFAKRGMCARDPRRALADGVSMRMPRKTLSGDEWKPYSPAATLPYSHKWRLFRSPNDGFLVGHTHAEGMSLFDILQPVYAALFGGAVHPTAEGHAIVADYVVHHVRTLVDKKVESAAQ